MDSSWSSSPHWGTFWGQFQIEMVGGVLGAFVFLFIVLILFKPKIRIAKFICRINPTGGGSFYIFKFVNVSFFSAHDIKVELYKSRKIPTGDGKHNNTYDKLTIHNGDITHVKARTPFWNKRPDNPHCVVVRSFDDLNTILSDDMNAIILKVSLKHGLTGLPKVYEQDYGNEEDIKVGKYTPGTKFGFI